MLTKDETDYLLKFEWLQKCAPAYAVKAENVKSLKNPSEFYQTLLEQCSIAKRRIIIASLYLGTGNLEADLVDKIKEALDKSPELNVRILLDANRGSRGKTNSSRTMLIPVLKSSYNCCVYLYHTPKLRGILRWLLPDRYNELVGIQHMKLYIFDDSVLISGANLSHDYFTNRQDRYIFIEDCKPLVDFYTGLIELLGSMSFQLTPENTLNIDPSWKYHPYKSPYKSYAMEAKKQLIHYYNSHVNSLDIDKNSDTIVYPLVEFPPFEIHNDSEITSKLLENAEAESTFNLATGYFNLPDVYTNTIFKKSLANFNVLFSHPLANSFHTAKGPASFIPTAYSCLTNNFYDQIKKFNVQNRIICFEYQRTGWTFHSKGLWYTPKNYKWPIFTVVGSSNYGARSLNCDLESQLVIVTDNKNLQNKFHTEKFDIFKSTALYSPDSEKLIAPLWVRFVLKVFKNYF
ncbi:CDP-diacylglycerol--glycerol-3-phosphate 3-phosphatidyltransferase, mitochondrial [Adelges cooleyi]|uniref:CDP-diacylglycerol--glycerol-3-phosphate 3-phosphatidyltransferase, mitochondrial n=1 Tax=Adelges cooleyi TaxID=133065 RepID=UPI0021806922|nr:CDP-diacylglycerol--glycerol-3-phosphate 3-phosphatidyltransferase, mitochondrial [Adelges cooleyi]